MSRDLAIEVQLLCIGLKIMLDKIVDLRYILPRHKTAHTRNTQHTHALLGAHAARTTERRTLDVYIIVVIVVQFHNAIIIN